MPCQVNQSQCVSLRIRENGTRAALSPARSQVEPLASFPKISVTIATKGTVCRCPSTGSCGKLKNRMRDQAMTVTEAIIAKVRQLSAEDQQKVLELIRNLPAAEQADRGSGANASEQPGKA